MKFKEFWIKDHKMARTETKAYLYDAFDLPPNLDKSVGVIHVIEYAAHEQDQLIIGALKMELELLKEDHAWMCNFAEDVIKEKHKAWLKYNELKDKHEPEIVSADIENFKLNIKTERLRCIKENIAEDFYPVNKIAIGGSDIKWLMKQYEQLEEENAAIQDSLLKSEMNNHDFIKENAALKAELSEKIAYIEQLEKASDTQSNQYHQMRENLESIIEKQKAEYNDILEPIFQDKLKKLESENASLKAIIEVMEAQQDKLAGENRELREKLDLAVGSLKSWYDWEQEQIRKEGPYVGVAINKLINEARETLQKIGEMK